MGVHMIVGRFFVDARARAKTPYALTNRRAIIVSGIFTQTINSIPLRTLTDISVQERADRTGTILLGRPNPFSSWQAGLQWPGTSQYATPAFELIPEARYVHDQVIAAQRAA
jgi:hypothetical protein